MNIVEYIWLDAENKFRSKIRVLELDSDIASPWNYDGSSTNQATTESSEVILKVVSTFNHPFMNGKLNVCATYDINDNPISNNHYHKANEIFNKKKDEMPWFGLEQEYFLYKDNKPLGLVFDTTIDPEYPEPTKITHSNIYYCSHINQDQLGVKIAHNHLMACLKAGIKISGINAEVVPGQWEFQVGPCVGINAGDDMLAARYLLKRIAAMHDIEINFHPKPLPRFSGSGMHTNFSTCKMRNDDGLKEIYRVIENLKKSHETDILKYGSDNNLRLTGSHETANIKEFSYGIGSRNTSIRIGYDTAKNNKGYFEDRRPAANCDPYLVTSSIFSCAFSCA